MKLLPLELPPGKSTKNELNIWIYENYQHLIEFEENKTLAKSSQTAHINLNTRYSSKNPHHNY